MNAKRRSHKRYIRPRQRPQVAPTDDDKQLFLELYRHGVLDSRAVFRLFPHRSTRALNGRLLKLFQAGYILRLKQMRAVFVEGGGSRHEAYVLDTGAEDWLWNEYRLHVPKRTKQLTSRSASYLFHEIELAHLVISIRQSAEKREGLEFLYPHEIYKRWAPEILARDNLPYRLSARVDWFGYRQIASTRPDAFFMLRYPNRPEGKQRRALFLEVDMGTETVNPGDRKVRSLTFWKDTSVLRKLVVYAYAHKTRSHQTEFGVPNFQVLIVTKNPGKVRAIQQAYQERLAGLPYEVSPIRFLFSDFETLAKYDDLFDAPLTDGDGKAFSILP